MQRVFKILSLISRILAVIILSVTVVLTISVAYIMFAPDNYPKPFYLMYLYPTPIIESLENLAPSPTPTPQVNYKPGEGIMVQTSSQIINLADSSGHKYIRVGVTLEFAPPSPEYATLPAEEKTAATTSFTTEITPLLPVVDDVVITLLSQKKFEDLYTADGKEAVRQEILQQINAQLPTHPVIAIYFTEFVIE